MTGCLRCLARSAVASIFAVVSVASPAVGDDEVSLNGGFLPLAAAVSPPYFFRVHVEEITLPELSEIAGDEGLQEADSTPHDTADLYAPYLSKAQRVRYKHKLPIVVVLQGANVDKEQYAILGQRLARLGMIAVIPNSFRPFPDFGDVLFSDVQVLPRALKAVQDEADRPRSPIHDMPDFTAVGAVGHSLGGSVALYAAAGICDPFLCEGYPVVPFTRPPGLRAVAVYGANLALPTPPGGVIQLSYDPDIPIGFLAGTQDGISTPEEVADTYDSVVDPEKALISIVGTNHYGILKENNPMGAQADLSEPELPQLYGASQIAQAIAVWLRAKITDDPRAEYWLSNVGESLDGTVVVDALE